MEWFDLIRSLIFYAVQWFTMSSTSALRNIPAVDEILRHEAMAVAATAFPRQQLTKWIRNSVDECRKAILNGADFDKCAAIQFVINSATHQSAFEEGRRQHPVINATGILLHTNLGRAPLADAAIHRMAACSAFTNVEINLHSGKRNKRGERVADLLASLTGAEDAVVVNNCAAATMLTLQTIATGREVIVSRGQLVEIGGGYRLPEVFAASGAILKEVGTTNRTYLRDYENAITENTAAIIRVHRSNFCLSGFVTEPTIAELVSVGRSHDIPVIDDIGSGCMQRLGNIGLDEPTVPDSIAAGADLSLFSGDKLFGGPQAGLIVGARNLTDALRQSPMMRALRLDKLTLAALEATIEIHLSGKAETELPLLRMISMPADEIRNRCETVLAALTVPDSVTVEIDECTSQIGGGSAPGSEIRSCGLRVTGPSGEQFAQLLRNGRPSVMGRIQDECVILDLRTVADDQVATVAGSLNSALNSVTSDEV